MNPGVGLAQRSLHNRLFAALLGASCPSVKQSQSSVAPLEASKYLGTSVPSSSRGHRASSSFAGWPEARSPRLEPWGVSRGTHAPDARTRRICMRDFSPSSIVLRLFKAESALGIDGSRAAVVRSCAAENRHHRGDTRHAPSGLPVRERDDQGQRFAADLIVLRPFAARLVRRISRTPLRA
jgi:hypothetical protein